jgi:hypothetical protein
VHTAHAGYPLPETYETEVGVVVVMDVALVEVVLMMPLELEASL